MILLFNETLAFVVRGRRVERAFFVVYRRPNDWLD
jgi:hypothetical protein